MAMKATSPLYLVAQRLIIIKPIYSLVFITMCHKVSHFGIQATPCSPSMLEAFLLDPDLMDDRTSDASNISISTDSTSQGIFRFRVVDRDRTCVMTGDEQYCMACHIVPHAKGHQVRHACSEYLSNHSRFSFHTKYMANLNNHRHAVMDPPLDDINDIRNGILLSPQLRPPFVASEVA